jgi:hypothetical protein
MRITGLYTYPVKGCHRLEHDAARVDPWGLAGDRRWMMVDADGVGITQRDAPRLTQLTARPRSDGGLALSAPGVPDLVLDVPADGPKESVRIFRHRAPVLAYVAESEWSSAFLGRDVRLVRQADPAGGDGDPVSLADGYPVLLANEGSLSAVNDWLAEAGEDPVPMTRFRPNLVVSGAPAWAEDDWLGRRLRIGEVVMRVASGCGRCLVTTIDQETGEQGREPLRVLGRGRRVGGAILFAVNLVPDLSPSVTGTIRLDDPVTVMS